MTALHRVKAYFGMVPADELDEYDGYDHRYDGDRYYDDDRRRPSDRSDRYDRYDGSYGSSYEGRHDSGERRREFGAHRDRWDDRSEGDGDRYGSDRHEGDRYEHAPRPRAPRDGRDLEALRPEAPQGRRDEARREDVRRDEGRHESRDDGDHEEPEVETSRSSRGRSWATNTGPNHTSVRPTSVGSRSTPSLSPIGTSPSGAPASVGGAATRGALAVDTQKAEEKVAAAPEVESGAPAEITSLQPTSYNEARVIGERYRDGIPVIMNLTDLDEVAAKRLVDFAAGLAFALRGSIEKVTNRVFLLSPPNVEVSAAERRKLAETSYTASS